jgi:hypothetical protein
MKYRCKFNGVILDFDDKDTQQMDSHEGYERVEVVEKNEDLVHVVEDVAPPELKKKKKKKKAK